MSSRAFLVDMIHSVGEKTALVDHLEEKILAGENVEVNTKILSEVLSLRREQMSLLLDYAKKPNPTRWCNFKHACKSFTQDVEVYEATLSEESLKIMEGSARILAMETSLFLGLDFEVCARCLYDKLLVEQKEKESEKGND